MNTLGPVSPEFDAKQQLARADWPRFVLVSVVVVLPCFWHRHLEAGDLASHVYNAWLAHLIQNGQAPGLYIVRQWNNVLFDFTLIGLAKILGLHVAERIATSAAVLIYFWGAFAFVCSITRRTAWNIIPVIAITAYGWTFEEGLMNYYLSIGLAFIALAILRSRLGRRKSFVAILAGLIWLANPLGFIFLVSAAAYIFLAESLTARKQGLLFAASALLIVAAHFYIVASLPQNISPGSRYGIIWKVEPGVLFDGHDQLWLYAPKYLLLAYLLECFIWGSTLIDVDARKRIPRFWRTYLLPAQLYGLVLVAATLLPTDIRLPQYAAPLEFLTERLTSVSAILACCLLATAKPRKWHFAASAMIAALFFVLLYKDTATIGRMEDQVESIVRTLPPGQRVVANINWPGPGSRVERQHIVDRACIGWCFSYGNYEPSTGQFRIRAEPGDPFVVADPESVGAAAAGTYVVQKSDLPLHEIYFCDPGVTKLCIYELASGDTTGAVLTQRPQ
jgi:hypothetical protein